MSQKSRKRVHELDENQGVPVKKSTSSSLRRSNRKRSALSQIENFHEVDPEASSSTSAKRRRNTIDGLPAEVPKEHVAPVVPPAISVQSTPRGILDLPAEVFDNVYKFMNVKEKLNLTLVSNKFNKVYGSSKNLNEVKLTIDIRKLTSSDRISRPYTAIKLINFNDDRFERKLKRFQKNIVSEISSSVKEIEMEDCDLQGYNYVKILENFPNLESLKLENCDVDVVNAVPNFKLNKLRKIDVTMNNMIALFQDFLDENNLLEEIVLRGVYYQRVLLDSSDDEDEIVRYGFVNPTINIFGVLGPLIIRQKKLKVLDIADSRFFSNDAVATPEFQLTKLFLPMPHLYPAQEINLYRFICSQSSLEAVNFNIMPIQPTEFFEQSLSRVLKMPTLREISLVFYSNIGMRQAFMENVVNRSVTNFAINIASADFNQCLEVATDRFPNAEIVWLMKEDEVFTDANFLRPLNKLKNLKELQVQHFDILQVARVRCPKLKKLKLDPVNNETCDLLQFIIAHGDMEIINLRLGVIEEDEFQEFHDFLEFTLKWCKKIKQMHVCICSDRSYLDDKKIQETVDRYAQKGFRVIFCNKSFSKS